MKKIFVIILLFFDLILLVGGLTCLIIGSILYKDAQVYQAPLVNALFALGFIGVGSFLSTLLGLLSAILLLID